MPLFNTHVAKQDNCNEKESFLEPGDLKVEESVNPVVDSARFVYEHTDIVKINYEGGVKTAAQRIYKTFVSEGYSPLAWRHHPLHLQPPVTYCSRDPRTKACLDWIFLVSSLNFSFWSEKTGTVEGELCFGVEWREGWGDRRKKIWRGYWSLVAAINKALEANIPITDPLFYYSKVRCPDAVLENVFRAASHCPDLEAMPLLAERIAVMREVASILVSKYGGSYAGLLAHFNAKYSNQGTALQLVQMIVEEFPPFRDESSLNGRKVFFWKRAQIMVAETWAAFYPPPDSQDPHPFFPGGIGQLTMFADYRVPQILHHFRILTYPPSLLSLLTSFAPISPGSQTELSIRAASILAVEAVRDEIVRLQQERRLETGASGQGRDEFTSVIIDFFLWDLAKKIERGEERIDDIETNEMVPAHRTRSIWY
ncbi:hypothetical protein JB92DRAFT_2718831 [Gautieria morchelliformis]|nr:hypothetical protein JB92DRAFT_2718831 [Gautieria morchelliformis]